MATDSADRVLRRSGDRLRQWRRDHNWDGPSVADRLAVILARQVKWPELRQYETGRALPDVPTANALVEVYQHDLAALLAPRPQQSRSQHAPAAAEDVQAVMRQLEERGHDPAAAADLLHAGASVGSSKAWLRLFSPEVAVAWLNQGVGPTQAGKLHRSGLTPEVGGVLDRFGWGNSDTQDSQEALRLITGLMDRGVPPLGAAVWHECDLTLADSEEWLAEGWDLLFALPWAAADMQVEDAARWVAAGLDYVEAQAVSRTLDSEKALAWVRSGVNVDAIASWEQAGFEVDKASSWNAEGFDATSSKEWACHGLDPLVARQFEDAGIAPAEAAQWDLAGIPAETAEHWHRAGWTQAHAATWVGLGFKPEEAEPLRHLELDPNFVKEWVDTAVSPEQLPKWLASGLTPSDAQQWSFTSAERAARLTRRGVRPDVVLERMARGRQRVVEANPGWPHEQY